MKYHANPAIEIEAHQFTEAFALMRWSEQFPGNRVWEFKDGTVVIPTLNGDTVAHRGDWIIRGELGDFYPCKADAFSKRWLPGSAPTPPGATP